MKESAMALVTIEYAVTVLLCSLALGGVSRDCMAGESGAEDRQRQFLQAHMPRFEKPPTTPADRDRGFLAYWGNPTANFYSNVPPPHEDLVRDAAIRTPAGEDVPLLIGVWGLRPMGPAALWLTKPLFKMTVRSPTIDRGERPLLF